MQQGDTTHYSDEGAAHEILISYPEPLIITYLKYVNCPIYPSQNPPFNRMFIIRLKAKWFKVKHSDIPNFFCFEGEILGRVKGTVYTL